MKFKNNHCHIAYQGAIRVLCSNDNFLFLPSLFKSKNVGKLKKNVSATMFPWVAIPGNSRRSHKHKPFRLYGIVVGGLRVFGNRAFKLTL